jgi:surfactin synthase thioesterase subunit
MPESLNIIALDFPGHGKRMEEALLTNIHAMADDLYDQIKDHLNRPYAVWGHSLGGIVSYLLLKKIEAQSRYAPRHLFISGSRGPSVKRKTKNVHLFPRKAFIDKVKGYGGIPEEVLQEKDLMDLFEPILRADFQALETFEYQQSEPLETPITVMIGIDETIHFDEAAKWQGVTCHPIDLRQFPGGHFFIFKYFSEIGRMVSQRLCGA